MVTRTITPRLYPFQGSRLNVDGASLHYLDEGRGDPVVMLHGNPSWSFYYRNLVQALRGRFRVIAPDHVGCGLSDKPTDDRYPYTLQRRVDDIDQLLEHLGVRSRITLVLHDWGGMIGLAYMARQPERVGRVILFNTAGFRLPGKKRFPWELRLARSPVLGAFLVRGLNLFARGAARAGVTRRKMEPEVRAGYLAPYASFAERIAVHRFVQDIPLCPRDPSFSIVEAVEDNLARLRNLPVLIAWGARDFIFDDAFLAEWRHRLPGAEVHRIADAGHYVLEDAFEDVLPLVRDFLDRHPIAGEAAF